MIVGYLYPFLFFFSAITREWTNLQLIVPFSLVLYSLIVSFIGIFVCIMTYMKEYWSMWPEKCNVLWWMILHSSEKGLDVISNPIDYLHNKRLNTGSITLMTELKRINIKVNLIRKSNRPAFCEDLRQVHTPLETIYVKPNKVRVVLCSKWYNSYSTWWIAIPRYSEILPDEIRWRQMKQDEVRWIWRWDGMGMMLSVKYTPPSLPDMPPTMCSSCNSCSLCITASPNGTHKLATFQWAHLYFSISLFLYFKEFWRRRNAMAGIAEKGNSETSPASLNGQLLQLRLLIGHCASVFGTVREYLLLLRRGSQCFGQALMVHLKHNTGSRSSISSVSSTAPEIIMYWKACHVTFLIYIPPI